MGYGMANNLATKSTDPLLVYDVNQDAVQKFIETHPNARAASSPGDIAEQAATVITMLPESSHVESVYKAMRDAVDKDSILVDSSTIDADVSRRVAADIMSKNATAFDAPVSGGTLGANAGTLTFMVGAPSLESFEKVKPVLCHMGHNVVYCGCNGSGQVAKLCNNMLLGISMIGVSEAMLLGTRLGMDAHLLASILNTSTGRCWSSDTYNPHPGVIPTAPSGKDYKGGFSNKLMAKDLRIAMKAAKDASADPVLGTVAAQIYNQLSVTKDFDSLDFSSVYKWMQTHPETKAVKS
ncbi:3-hydroxyisobutyrate dehydrogenase [Phycomyces blakesleeanus]